MKKGQVQITETIAVIFIFFVLVLFGLLFYSRYQQVALLQEERELLADRAIETTLRTLFLPELQCTRGDAEPEDNCLDLVKVRNSKEVFEKYLVSYYFDIFSYAKISVHQLYPVSDQSNGPIFSDEGLILYEKKPLQPADEATAKLNYEPTFFVVTLRDETAGEGQAVYKFGYLEVGVYS